MHFSCVHHCSLLLIKGKGSAAFNRPAFDGCNLQTLFLRNAHTQPVSVFFDQMLSSFFADLTVRSEIPDASASAINSVNCLGPSAKRVFSRSFALSNFD